jgi:hypothetical protein
LWLCLRNNTGITSSLGFEKPHDSLPLTIAFECRIIFGYAKLSVNYNKEWLFTYQGLLLYMSRMLPL